MESRSHPTTRDSGDGNLGVEITRMNAWNWVVVSPSAGGTSGNAQSRVRIPPWNSQVPTWQSWLNAPCVRRPMR